MLDTVQLQLYVLSAQPDVVVLRENAADERDRFLRQFFAEGREVQIFTLCACLLYTSDLVFLDVDGSVHVLADDLLIDKDGVLVVVALPGPVSYTHLDVYKRQGLLRSNFAFAIVIVLLCFETFS